MEKWLGNYFLGESHFSYTKECFRNCFRNHFWLECKQRGGETRGGESIPSSPSPKAVLDPPTYDTISPPFVHAMSFYLQETGTDQTNPTF